VVLDDEESYLTDEEALRIEGAKQAGTHLAICIHTQLSAFVIHKRPLANVSLDTHTATASLPTEKRRLQELLASRKPYAEVLREAEDARRCARKRSHNIDIHTIATS
jgi:hypothetical protein